MTSYRVPFTLFLYLPALEVNSRNPSAEPFRVLHRHLDPSHAAAETTPLNVIIARHRVEISRSRTSAHPASKRWHELLARHSRALVGCRFSSEQHPTVRRGGGQGRWKRGKAVHEVGRSLPRTIAWYAAGVASRSGVHILCPANNVVYAFFVSGQW